MHGEKFINILEMHDDEMVTMCFMAGLQALSFDSSVSHSSEVTTS